MDDIEEFLSTSKCKDKEELIKQFELKIKLNEIQIDSFRRAISVLKQSGKENLKINLKWREEIRFCFENQEGLLTSREITNLICARHNIDPDRNIKIKISTGLSIMASEQEIGRHSNDGKVFLYGHKRLFNRDENGTLTIKK